MESDGPVATQRSRTHTARSWQSAGSAVPGNSSNQSAGNAWGRELNGREGHGRLLAPDEQPIQPRLSGTGSLRPELEALFAAAGPVTRPAELRALVVEANVTGKRS